MTSSKNTLKSLDTVGYRVLDDHRYVWRKTGAAEGALTVVVDATAIRAQVGAEDTKVLDDMAGLPATPMLIEAGGQQALLFFSIKRKAEDILWYDLLHAGDLPLFADHAQALANAVLPDGPAVLAADCRFTPDGTERQLTGAIREKLAVPRFFKTERLAPHEIDHLYTELQLLDLKLD